MIRKLASGKYRFYSRRPMKTIFYSGIIAFFCAACGANRAPSGAIADLAITNASVLDVRSGRVLPETTVLVRDGIIAAVISDRDWPQHEARRVVNGRGRLLTPGFVDVHSHTHLIFGDSSTSAGVLNRALVMQPDSMAAYRRIFAESYLPFGVTAVRDVASDERYMSMLLAWTQRSPDAPDFYPVGAYLVSAEAGRTPVEFAVAVADSQSAAAKVREYHARGIRHIKLYWRLREPHFRAAFNEARRLGMNVTAHVDQHVMTISQALDIGLRNVEHVFPIALSVMPAGELKALYDEMPRLLGGATPGMPGLFYLVTPELWNHLGSNDARVASLIARFKTDDVSLTPTLHVFGRQLGIVYFTPRTWDSSESTAGFTPYQRARAMAGYGVMASYVRRMYEGGVRLNLGTDALEPGKAALSEMLLLHEAGIPMTGVFQIATLNSARSIGMGEEFGAIEPGKRANLILFEQNPLHDPRAILGPKTVFKDGVGWRR